MKSLSGGGDRADRETRSADGLVTMFWLPGLGLGTSLALIAYFVVAVTMHVRARDLGRILSVNAVGMLVICAAVVLTSFVA